jgi:hypothetical protein
VICDGAKSYAALEKEGICSIMPMKIDGPGQEFCNINTTNGFHSFIKGRYRAACGFATKYLNRYNALFEKAFGGSKYLVDVIYAKLCGMYGRFFSFAEAKTHDLLEIRRLVGIYQNIYLLSPKANDVTMPLRRTAKLGKRAAFQR